jgi:N-acetylglucosamine-6-phosphate deacetylase
VGVQPPGRGGLAAPGFIDLQVNGFGGHDFSSTDVAGYEAAGRALTATGVTAYQPTFISSPLEIYGPALATASEAQRQVPAPRILGVHLEGPFLSPQWAGAHDPAHLIDPDLALAQRWCDTGAVSYMTVAPELPGGLELVRFLTERGVIVAIGHTDADTRTAHAAFDQGAQAITHIFNAHRRWSHRDTGPAGAALMRPAVTVHAIVDHIHLAPEATWMVAAAAGGRLALVTDAISAAGLGDGTFPLGGLSVDVRHGEARLSDGTLAGSVLTMDRAVRNLTDLGVSEVEALCSASRVPARLMGRPELGDLKPNTPADIVVLDDRLQVRRTIVDGDETFTR